MLKKVSEIEQGDVIINLGYVAEVEENNGYLTYPSTSGGMDAAMSENTYLIVFHDNAGNENYLLVDSETEFMVRS